MKRLMGTLVLAALMLVGSRVWADYTVYFREPGKKSDSQHKGIIETDSPSGIKIRTGKKDFTVPAEQIRQIKYDGKTVAALDFEKPDNALAKALRGEGKKAELLNAALAGFQNLDDNQELQNTPVVHRYLRYRIAQTMAIQAQDDPKKRDDAITALSNYKKDFADGWEIVPAMQLLASLQQDKGDAEAASQTFADLAGLPGLPPALKLDNQLRSARLLMRAEKYRQSEEKLKQIEAGMSANDPQRALVSVSLMQSRIAQKGNLDGMETQLTKIIRAAKDDHLLALAHNTLGDYYRIKNNKEQAFWEYCKVDVLYNQDREEHAKALYYLSQLYDLPRNDNERAQECLTRLKSPSYDGTLYQRLAKSATKSGE
jgi:tetratricopeptide (TPR) repeat protein